MLQLPLKEICSTEAVEMLGLSLSLAHTQTPTHTPPPPPLSEGGVPSYYQIKCEKQDQTKLPPHFRPHI